MIKTLHINISAGERKVTKKIRRIILKAHKNLPEEAKRFLSRYPILFVADSYSNKYITDAYTFEKRFLTGYKSLIYLNPHIWAYKEKEAIKIIHHEIAHNFLGHISQKIKHYYSPSRDEKEVEQLLNKWDKMKGGNREWSTV